MTTGLGTPESDSERKSSRNLPIAGARILLIDDNPVALEAIVEDIEAWGCVVTTAESGIAGLERFATSRYELVVSDLRLSDMSGLSICEHVRMVSPETPVIMLSAETESELIIQAVHEGAFDYVVKSEERTLLRSAIRRALEQLRLARENAALIARLSKTHQSLDAVIKERTMELEQSNRALEEVNRSLTREMQERTRVEAELRLSQKLEAIGQLAAGIAHEINTPMQYVGDSTHFLLDAFRDLLKGLERTRELCLGSGGAEGLARLSKELDIEYLMAEAPKALERTLEGVARVTAITRAMKDFAHPDQREKEPGDINRALRSALIVTRNEYKYVADVEVELGELPPVLCHIGELNQVFLNLIVNAAHAIAELVGSGGDRGLIRVQTVQEGSRIVIKIGDNGCGIPAEIQSRVFDPFFTTKPVGKGTGQGLGIARAIVVDKHGGTLTFESHLGLGTTFIICLPNAGLQIPKAVRPGAES